MSECLSSDYLPRLFDLLKTNSRPPLLSLALARNSTGSCPSAEMRKRRSSLIPWRSPHLRKISLHEWQRKPTGCSSQSPLLHLSQRHRSRASSWCVLEFQLLYVWPLDWCLFTPTLRQICFREFHETALRNVSCIFLWQKKTQTPTT